MENLEALVVHVLLSESLDILLDEKEVGLVSLDRVAEVILVDVLFVIPQERSDSLDAGSGLQILRGQKLVKVFLKGGTGSVDADLEHLDDSHKDLLEAFEIPILIDNGVDNSGEENLLGLVSEKIHEVVHLVNGLKVTHVFLTPLREKLLSD